ncbi:MAG: translational GTPase TypA [Alphaproteobacteria bacterium]|nr:translational GTPase TypA [Alphaproteobacteria bacterium]
MELRNIAIIAHVDHGKTTLVDELLKQSGTFKSHQQVDERAMDSNDLEKERGITILAKCTSVEWNNIRINIVDTPGHADFGGEVERILSMVDGVVVLVDSAEGPMPQTKFVVGKALKLGLKPIVVVNKADRSDARPDEVHDEIFDLFDALDANEEQLDFPTLFACGRDGWCVEDLENGARENLEPLFELIVKHVPAPAIDVDAPFKMLATTLEADPYIGRVLTGRVHSGSIKINAPIKALDRDCNLVEQGRVSKILAFRGLKRTPLDVAEAGDIVAIAGLNKATVANTLCAIDVEEPLMADPIDPPTLTMTFSVNDSPLAGQEGDKLTSRVIWDRLEKEAEGNVALQIKETADKGAFEVSGRGELQLGVLIETLRREGFELSISRPHVIYQKDENGKRTEPIEEVVIDVDAEFSGVVVEKMGLRKAEMTDMRPSGGGKTRITFLAPSRGLIGYLSEFLTDTKGTGLMNRLFHSYGPYKGAIEGRRNGVLISNCAGTSVPFALWSLEARGPMIIDAGVPVYEGMIIGEHTKSNDLDVNAVKTKKLTNMRASGKDDAVTLTTPKKMGLEEALAYIQDDERIEVTPTTVRLRKAHLSFNDRKRAAKIAAG